VSLPTLPGRIALTLPAKSQQPISNIDAILQIFFIKTISESNFNNKLNNNSLFKNIKIID